MTLPPTYLTPTYLTANSDLPVSWSQATLQGIDKYFTGKPCKRGHIAPRYANNGCCLTCAVEKLRQRRNTPDKLVARERKKFVFLESQHEQALKEIERRGWHYIGGHYADQKSRYRVECQFSHGFDISFWRLCNKDQNCKGCEVQKLYLPVELFVKRAAEHGCGIVEFIDKWCGTRTKVILRDPNGHDWPTTVFNSYHNNGWSCPNCSSLIGERITRAIFEATFGKPFPKVRLDWLLSPLGRKMELDGYNEELKLAFEYNGPWHQSSEQRIRDEIKQQECTRRGIILIVIDSVNPFPPENVRLAVEKALRGVGM